jgi:hypothetical protein
MIPPAHIRKRAFLPILRLSPANYTKNIVDLRTPRRRAETVPTQLQKRNHTAGPEKKDE